LRRIGILWAALIVIAIGGAMWLARAPLLQGAASLWIVSDPLEPADVVAIFGGGLDVRPFAAAKYFHEGLVKKILISNVRPGPAERIGAVMSHVEVTRHVLLKLNVPEAAIDVFGVGNTNTRDEATSLAEWAKRNNAHSVIVPTEIFSARRVRWIVRHAFAGTDTNVQIQALDSTDFNRRDWWGFEAGVVAFQNEVIKYIYYRIKY
jgi:uncharacterized SAM-binding protein YcdF (DUF218 family)